MTSESSHGVTVTRPREASVRSSWCKSPKVKVSSSWSESLKTETYLPIQSKAIQENQHCGTIIDGCYWDAEKGVLPCLRCNNCNHLQKSKVFEHPTTLKRYKIKHYLTWASNYVIYVLQCPCKMLYVGETTMECRNRVNKHKSTIRTERHDLPVSKHCPSIWTKDMM